METFYVAVGNRNLEEVMAGSFEHAAYLGTVAHPDALPKVIVVVDQEGQERTFNTEARKCSGCGCTEHRPCPGGCSWVAWDRCNRCGKQGESRC